MSRYVRIVVLYADNFQDHRGGDLVRGDKTDISGYIHYI